MLKGDSLKNIVVFIVDDFINVVYNNRVINKKLNNVIDRGFIVDKNSFIEEVIKLFKKEKIKTKLFGENIAIVKNSFYSVSDIAFITNIFNELGFLKVDYLDIKELFSSEDATFIEINNSYLVINLDKGLYFDLDYFKDIPRILDYFSLFIKEDLILFGTNKNIPKINVKNKKVYYYDNFENYVIKSLLRVKKCG